MNRVIIESFARWHLLGPACIIASLFLIAGSAYGVADTYTAPKQKTEQLRLVTYSLSSSFGYDVHLGKNTLYGAGVLTEKDISALPLNIVERIDGRFYHSIAADQPLESVSHEVEVRALLENPNIWSKTIVLSPRTLIESQQCSVIFAIDTDMLLELAEIINSELLVPSTTYNITIEADVRTTALTPNGAIEELITHSITSKLQPTMLTWKPPLDNNHSGFLESTEVTPVSPGTDRIWWPLLLVLAATAAVYFAWSYNRAVPLLASVTRRDAAAIRRKYKDLVVDVTELPPTQDTQAVIEVSSLDALAVVAERLLRPVLRKAVPDGWIYCVVDGPTTYQYISRDCPAYSAAGSTPTVIDKS